MIGALKVVGFAEAKKWSDLAHNTPPKKVSGACGDHHFIFNRRPTGDASAYKKFGTFGETAGVTELISQHRCGSCFFCGIELALPLHIYMRYEK